MLSSQRGTKGQVRTHQRCHLGWTATVRDVQTACSSALLSLPILAGSLGVGVESELLIGLHFDCTVGWEVGLVYATVRRCASTALSIVCMCVCGSDWNTARTMLMRRMPYPRGPVSRSWS